MQQMEVDRYCVANVYVLKQMKHVVYGLGSTSELALNTRLAKL